MDPRFRRQSSLTLGFSAASGVMGRPVQMEKGYAHSVSGGAGGHGTRISTVSYGGRVGSGFGGGFYEYQPGQASTTVTIGNEKVAMQHLNDRLANYLETVRKLEKENETLEIKIREVLEKTGPLEGRDYSKYFLIIKELKDKITDLIKENAKQAICVDNARLASDDFRVKLEYEMSMRLSVEADVARLRKLLDDTNIIRLHLESEIESLKEELINLQKNHQKELAELRAQITSVGVHVDVDAPKGQDLAKIMADMRAKYEKIVLKNQEELQSWHENQITEVKVQMTESSTALKEATGEVTETRRRYQSLEIELQAAQSLNASLEATLRDIELRYNMELEKYNAIILRLQEELTQIRNEIQLHTTEYEHLLDIKVKLEAEIAEYRRLLDGEDIHVDTAEHQKTIQTKVVTITQTLVDGKVVSESQDVKSSKAVESSS